jgi:UDP-N-acetylglucosamine 2-epimerase (non-hydrolysing)
MGSDQPSPSSFDDVARHPVEQHAPGRRRVMLVFGTRPEAIKLAPIAIALRESAIFDPVVVITGQHREMLDQVLDHFSIKPDFDLEVMSDRQTLSDLTVRTLSRLTPILEAEAPDVVVVQGDTTAAMTGALGAFYDRIPVDHVEAGLRSGDLSLPFPEELNRRVVSQMASLHLAPTDGARQNLLRESIDPSTVIVTGNTVIDALHWSAEHRAEYTDSALEEIESSGQRVILVTAHRRESWGDPMRSIGRALAAIARAEPDVTVVVPIHRNPAVRETLLPSIGNLENVHVCEPLAYGEFVRLINRSSIILSDSGGLQEEGPALGKPVLVTRDVTERPEAVRAGGVRLVGTNAVTIIENVERLLHDPVAYAAMAVRRDVYGDGYAAGRSIDAIAHMLGLGPAAEQFVRDHTEAQSA